MPSPSSWISSRKSRRCVSWPNERPLACRTPSLSRVRCDEKSRQEACVLAGRLPPDSCSFGTSPLICHLGSWIHLREMLHPLERSNALRLEGSVKLGPPLPQQSTVFRGALPGSGAASVGGGERRIPDQGGRTQPGADSAPREWKVFWDFAQVVCTTRSG